MQIQLLGGGDKVLAETAAFSVDGDDPTDISKLVSLTNKCPMTSCTIKDVSKIRVRMYDPGAVDMVYKFYELGLVGDVFMAKSTKQWGGEFDDGDENDYQNIDQYLLSDFSSNFSIDWIKRPTPYSSSKP
jgi:hypothetical protein